MLEGLLTAHEAAELMGTTDRRVRQLILDKRIPAVKKGSTYIVARVSIERYLKTKSRRGRPPSNAPEETSN